MNERKIAAIVRAVADRAATWPAECSLDWAAEKRISYGSEAIRRNRSWLKAHG